MKIPLYALIALLTVGLAAACPSRLSCEDDKQAFLAGEWDGCYESASEEVFWSLCNFPPKKGISCDDPCVATSHSGGGEFAYYACGDYMPPYEQIDERDVERFAEVCKKPKQQSSSTSGSGRSDQNSVYKWHIFSVTPLNETHYFITMIYLIPSLYELGSFYTNGVFASMTVPKKCYEPGRFIRQRC